MESILLAAAVLACPVGMGLMMWFMAKGMRKEKPTAAPGQLDDLRAEHQRLGDEIDRLERADDRPPVNKAVR
jgi:hypothetical protein